MIRYDLNDLRLFVAIAQHLNLTKGADEIGLAPSSASHRIKRLEDTLGITLLERKTKGVLVTLEGEILLRHAKKILADLEQMHADISPYTQGVQSHIRLWANTHATHTYLPNDLGRFLELFPNVSVALEEHTSETISLAIANGDVELGIVAEYNQSADIVTYPYKKDRLVLIVPMNHSLARSQITKFKQIVDHPFVILSQGFSIHTFTTNLALSLGKHLNIRAQVKSFDAVCTMVNAGVGIALVPHDSVAKNQYTNLTMIELDEPWAQRDLLVCVKQGAKLGHLSQVLLNHLIGDWPPSAQK